MKNNNTYNTMFSPVVFVEGSLNTTLCLDDDETDINNRVLKSDDYKDIIINSILDTIEFHVNSLNLSEDESTQVKEEVAKTLYDKFKNSI